MLLSETYNNAARWGFIDHDMNLLPDEEPFIRKLAENLIFYNTKRVHKGLGNMTPGGGYCLKCV
jgi:transposase InsO family protein